MLVAVSMLAGIQALRVLFALIIFHFSPTRPFQDTALLFITIFSAPVWLPLGLRGLKPHNALIVVVGGLALTRLALQFAPSASVSLILAAVAVIFWLGLLSLRQFWIPRIGSKQSYEIVSWIIVGLALDAALNSLFMTWDYAWRRDVPSMLCALAVAGLMGVTLWGLRKEQSNITASTTTPPTVALILIGPYLMLQVVVLQNPAFVATTVNTTVSAACAIVLIGNIVSLSALRTIVLRAAMPYRIFMGCMMIVGLFALGGVSGISASAVIIVIQFTVTAFLFVALHPASTQTHGTTISIGIASLLFLGLTVAYYIGYQYPAPDSASSFVLAGAGILLAGSAFRKSPLRADISPVTRSLKVVGVLFFVPIGLFAAHKPMSAVSVNQAFRLVVYNIHQGANVQGWIDLEAIAQVIEEQNPDVVVLQEVVRGQFITGGTDIAQWLATRLGMDYRFASATDRTYGGLLLTRLSVQDWATGYLPRAGAVQRRSYFLAVLKPDGVTDVTVIGTHFDHTSSQTRIEQAQHLISLWDGKPRTIITGDLNAQPGTAEIEVFEEAEMIDVQSATGNSRLATFPSIAPSIRIDWIFASPDFAFRDFAIPNTLASDHLPLAVTVELKE